MKITSCLSYVGPTPQRGICQQHKAVDGHSVQNPIAALSHLLRSGNHTTHSPLYSLFMGLCPHLFQITVRFRLFLKAILNFYLQIPADPLNLFLRHKNAALGFKSTFDRLWIASSVTPCHTERGHQQLLHFFSSYSLDGNNILLPHLCKYHVEKGTKLV